MVKIDESIMNKPPLGKSGLMKSTTSWSTVSIHYPHSVLTLLVKMHILYI